MTTAKGKPYPLRVQSEVDREMWLQRIQLAMDADTLPNYSISAPGSGEAGGAAAFLGELGGPKGGRGGGGGGAAE